MTNFRLFETFSLQTTISNLIKMAESSQEIRKHYGKKKNFSLRAVSPFLSVFKRLVLQRHTNQGLFDKGLKKEKKKKKKRTMRPFLIF